MNKEQIIEFIKKELESYVHDKESYRQMVIEDMKVMNFDEGNKHYRWYLEARDTCMELNYILDRIKEGGNENAEN